MQDVLSEYIEVVDSVLEENPILRLEKLLEKHPNITPGEIIQLSVKLRKQWNNYSNFGLKMCVVLTEEECSGQDILYRYDFSKDIEEIIKKGNSRSNIYYVNCNYEISKIEKNDDVISIEQCSSISKELSKIVLLLGMRGIDILADGTVFSADNFLSSYKDLMNAERMYGIYDYEKLLQGFYEQNIHYDISKRYFLQKGDVPKEYQSETIDKYPKLLRNKPEEFFQIDFVRYLKDHCEDTVIKEYMTVTGDRYDILVLDDNNQVYVFEIKWLGRSITTGMKVFENYNNEERAISGAYQLLDYVMNADTYKEYFLEFPVYCAVLLVFDARDENYDINYPDDVIGIPNLDLGKRFFMERKKISASKVYEKKKAVK